MSKLIGVLRRKIRSALVRTKSAVLSQRFGFGPEKIYGREFFNDGGFVNTPRAAESIAGFCKQRFSVRNVLDVGCGRGDYLSAFANVSIAAVGCDGASAGVCRTVPDALAFMHDLRKPLVLNKRFDLVLCIEVAEHLPKKYSDVLVRSIAEHANDIILFSAAPPGCSGTDHINCQPKSFWESAFAKHQCTLDEEITASLREFAAMNELPAWWREWSYVFRKANNDLEVVT